MKEIKYRITKTNGRLVLPLTRAAEYFTEISELGKKQIVKIEKVVEE